MNEQEEILIRSFVDRKKRDRYISFLSSKNGRKKFLETLYHDFAKDLDSRYSFRKTELPSEISQQINRLIGTKSDASCYVICTDPSIDACEIKLEEALQKRDFSSGVILSIIPGKLAYYLTEDPDPDYVLFKR